MHGVSPNSFSAKILVSLSFNFSAKCNTYSISGKKNFKFKINFSSTTRKKKKCQIFFRNIMDNTSLHKMMYTSIKPKKTPWQGTKSSIRIYSCWNWIDRFDFKFFFFISKHFFLTHILITCLLDIILILLGVILSWAFMGDKVFSWRKVVSYFFFNINSLTNRHYHNFSFLLSYQRRSSLIDKLRSLILVMSGYHSNHLPPLI